jgi:GGDEF domain-containing protein
MSTHSSIVPKIDSTAADRSCLAYFDLLSDAVTEVHESRAHCAVYQDFETFCESGLDPDGFVVDARDPASAVALLQCLRSGKHWLKPAFLVRELGPVAQCLADGPAQTHATMLETGARIRESIATLQETPAADDRDQRLLHYLYLRTERFLTPHRDWRHPSIYYYPLAEVLGPESSDTWSWLRSLRNRSLIEPVELLDRLRYCAECGGSHITYIDLCPNCSGIGIEETSFLHCYACGEVASEERFLRPEGIVCPKCRASLRHIGVDYDPALEHFLCNLCDHTFPEPDIQACCLHCDTRTAPERLVTQNIETLRLTESGRLAARSGRVEQLWSVLDHLNYTSPAYFQHTIGWLLDLNARHNQIHFSILCIKIANLHELMRDFGAGRVQQLLSALATRLRQLLRKEDIVTRTSETVFWLLLPQTDEKGCEGLLRRIHELAHSTRESSAVELVLASASVSAPGQTLPGETPELLLARMAGEVS